MALEERSKITKEKVQELDVSRIYNGAKAQHEYVLKIFQYLTSSYLQVLKVYYSNVRQVSEIITVTRHQTDLNLNHIHIKHNLFHIGVLNIAPPFQNTIT